MALLARTTYYDWKVILDADGDYQTHYVIAPDLEHAAWSALELSKSRNCRLVNVIKEDEW